MRVCSVVVMMLMLRAAAGAGVGEWKTYTAKRDVRDLVANNDNSLLWAATGGGMFSYRFSDSTFRQFTTSEGLKVIDLTAITTDAQGGIWTGAQNGFLHRYDPAKKEWNYISDIALRTDPNKRINALRVTGDTLFILSDIGVSLFSISKMEFADTYARFGTTPNQIVGNVTALRIVNGRIWVGTKNGIASTSMTNPNPSAPESWQLFTIAQGLPANEIAGFTMLDTSFIAATSGGLAAFDGTAWNRVQATVGLQILGISSPLPPVNANNASCPQAVVFMTPHDVWSYDVNGATTRMDSNLSVSLVSIDHDDHLSGWTNGVFFGSIRSGVYEYDHCSSTNIMFGGSRSDHYPPGPPSNKFVGLAVDARSVVWTGTGISTGEGFMSFDGAAWRSYTSAVDGRLAYGNFYKVNIGADNSKWVSSWGDGVALLDDAGNIRKVLNSTNGLFPSVDPAYVVVGGVATDENGVAWIANRTPPGDTAIVTFAQDSAFGYVRGLATRTNPITALTDVVIDQNGTKWFANFSRFEGVLPNALYFYNDRFALPRTNNGWGRLTAAEGLTTNKVYSLAVGRDGEVWVGSDEGITIIFNPAQPYAVAQYHPLRDQVIQSIVVDPLNNKWVGTRQGVFILSSDGTSILERYTVENTDGKLLDNDIASMAVDPHSGIMYFGTEKGLSSLTTAGVEPNRSFNALSFTPNPLILPSPVSVTIDGLIQNSLIKILTVDGNLVAEMRSPGGRVAFWDGKSARGEYVSSGIYFVIAYSEDGTKVAAGKVAVIRR